MRGHLLSVGAIVIAFAGLAGCGNQIAASSAAGVTAPGTRPGPVATLGVGTTLPRALQECSGVVGSDEALAVCMDSVRAAKEAELTQLDDRVATVRGIDQQKMNQLNADWQRLRDQQCSDLSKPFLGGASYSYELTHCKLVLTLDRLASLSEIESGG